MSGIRPSALLTLTLALQAAVVCARIPDAPALPAATDASSARPGLLAKLPDGRALNLRCSGAGAPTVVFESGYGATSLAWYRVQPVIARHHRACAYDRAGYGFSDPGPEPRDAIAIARDLDEGLRTAGISGPFVLVGHSAGALYVRAFADLRPRDVVGMVLVDPSVEYQDRRFASVLGAGAGSVAGQHIHAERCLKAAQERALPSADPKLASCAPQPKPGQPESVNAARLAEALRPSTWTTQLSELDTLWSLTSNEVAAGRRNYGAMPLIVLTADGTSAATAEPAIRAATLWRNLHQELASMSSRGREVLVLNTSHLIMRDQPESVISAIGAVIAESAR